MGRRWCISRSTAGARAAFSKLAFGRLGGRCRQLTAARSARCPADPRPRLAAQPLLQPSLRVSDRILAVQSLSAARLSRWASSIDVDARVRPVDSPGNSGDHRSALLTARTREVGGIAKMVAIATEQEACRAGCRRRLAWSMSAA